MQHLANAAEPQMLTNEHPRKLSFRARQVPET